MDYVERNLLKRLKNYEDVIKMATCILKVKNWSKILRSKDNSLDKNLIQKNVINNNIYIHIYNYIQLDFAIPSIILSEKSKDFWYEKIKREYEKHVKDLALEEAQEKFLLLISSYPMAYCSYFILKLKPPPSPSIKSHEHIDELKFLLEDDDE